MRMGTSTNIALVKNIFYLIILTTVLIACQNRIQKKTPFNAIIEEIPTPCKQGGEPNLFATENGEMYLSWIEYQGGSSVSLLFSKLEDDQWSNPQTVASGDDWFVNWADFPSLVAYKGESASLAAHWLQKSAEGTYDYDVYISQSHDGGHQWSHSFSPHRDGVSAEHGFVSLLPLSNDRIFATWLDGRKTKEPTIDIESDRPGFGDYFESHDHGSNDHGHGSGPMTLRSAVFDKNGKLYDEAELDGQVCDCCQTSAALSDKGLIVAYRDRSEDEIRDISIVRQVSGRWTKPLSIYNDNWRILGCPVNGPSIVADGNVVAIAWFSMADEQPQVKVAFSNNSGANFLPPMRVDEGDPLGRVDIILLSQSEAIVSWLEQIEDKAVIKMGKVNQQGIVGKSVTATTSNASRQSGFPVMAKRDEDIILAWTEVDSLTKVQTAKMNMR